MALAALALVVFGAIECPPCRSIYIDFVYEIRKLKVFVYVEIIVLTKGIRVNTVEITGFPTMVNGITNWWDL